MMMVVNRRSNELNFVFTLNLIPNFMVDSTILEHEWKSWNAKSSFESDTTQTILNVIARWKLTAEKKVDRNEVCSGEKCWSDDRNRSTEKEWIKWKLRGGRVGNFYTKQLSSEKKKTQRQCGSDEQVAVKKICQFPSLLCEFLLELYNFHHSCRACCYPRLCEKGQLYYCSKKKKSQFSVAEHKMFRFQPFFVLLFTFPSGVALAGDERMRRCGNVWKNPCKR